MSRKGNRPEDRDTVADPVAPAIAPAQVQTLEQLGAVLRRLRRRHARSRHAAQLTVRELAHRSGYSYGAISEYLSGKTLAPTDRFDVLIRLLGASPAEQHTLATARDRVDEQRRQRRLVTNPVPRELPPGAGAFIGRRAALATLDQLRCPVGYGPGAVPIAVITGTAGVGKTALALRWAHQAEADFPDGCLYVDLRGYHPDQPVPPAVALAGFLRSLGVDGAQIPTTEAERAGRFRSLLAGRRMLVLLDNARGTDQVRPLLPGEAGCVTVVTSRDALTGLVTGHGARRFDLAPLADVEAGDLLRVLLGRRAQEQPTAVAVLADRCARLPLTLRMVAQLAELRSAVPLAELAEELADLRQRLRRLDAGGESRSACRAAFSWSYRSLPAPVARAFRLIGLFPGYDLDEYTLAGLAGTNLEQARILLTELARAHLIQPVRAHRYGMHDLLRAYAAELVAADPEADRSAALARLCDQQLFASATAMELVAPFDQGRRPVVADPGWPIPPLTTSESAMSWLDAERTNLVATAVTADGQGDGETRADYAGRLAAILLRYLDTGGHHHDAELLYRHVAHAASSVARAHALTSLGIVCWRLGRYQEAADHQERALALARQAGDQAELGRALLGLGIIYWHLGRADQTLESGRQAYELFRQTGDQLGQARVLGNLGIIHYRLGNYPQAIRYHRQALKRFQQVGDPAGEANCRSGVGEILIKLGHYSAALEELHGALQLSRRAGYRESEAAVLSNFGVLYRKVGRLAESLEQHQQALDLIRQLADRTAEGYELGQLGAVYQLLGDPVRAVDYHHRGLQIARELGDDGLAAELFNRLGHTLWEWPRPRRALRAYRRALVRSRPHNRFQQARAHHGIARALTALGELRAAQPHWRQAASRYAALGVPDAATVQAEQRR